MPRDIQDPVVTVEEGAGGVRTSSTHPAFGQISLHRVTGGTTLYGSDFEHRNYVEIEIKESELQRDLSRDWYYPGKTLVRVAVSEAQWATFVSSMGVGSGTPCTITRRGSEMVPGFPLRQETDHFGYEIEDTFKDALEALETLKARVVNNVAGLSKKKQDDLLGPIEKALREVKLNVPFVKKQFDEHVEETMEKAKVELHGYFNQVVQRAGFSALGASELPLSLEDHSDE